MHPRTIKVELGEFDHQSPPRRSCGKQLRKVGVPPLVISRVMRHSSWETTQRHYAPGNVQSDAEVLNAILKSKNGKLPPTASQKQTPADRPGCTWVQFEGYSPEVEYARVDSNH